MFGYVEGRWRSDDPQLGIAPTTVSVALSVFEIIQ